MTDSVPHYSSKSGLPDCPCCGSLSVEDRGPIAAAQSFAGRRLPQPLPGGHLYRCGDCHLCFRHPRLESEELTRLYRGGAGDNWETPAHARADWRIATAWIRDRFPHGRILDVGCSSGGLLVELGDEYARLGIEMNPEAAREAQLRGIEIVGSDFPALADLTEPVNAVVAVDVIEHVPNPLELLAAMARALSSDGLLIVSTGNTDAWSWRLLGSRYWYCTIPEHLTFINPRWCDWAAARLGLRRETIERFSHDVGAGHAQRLKELVSNAAFFAMPSMAAWLRTRGFGGVDAAADQTLALTPPMWLSATDHLIARFRKP